jgi:hypothetical protein
MITKEDISLYGQTVVNPQCKVVNRETRGLRRANGCWKNFRSNA